VNAAVCAGGAIAEEPAAEQPPTAKSALTAIAKSGAEYFIVESPQKLTSRLPEW
jgi:hypothetical protein